MRIRNESSNGSIPHEQSLPGSAEAEIEKSDPAKTFSVAWIAHRGVLKRGRTRRVLYTTVGVARGSITSNITNFIVIINSLLILHITIKRICIM